MTPRDRYRTHIKRWSARREVASAHALVISRLRLVSFFGGVLLLILGLRDGYSWLAVTGVALLVVFGVFVVRHARVLGEIERADAALAVGSEGLARLARDWNALPDVPPPRDVALDTHPFARDLDLYGHASLTKWLGRSATRDGATRLANWLLAPAAPDDIRARQTSIEELAAKHDWRESLAIEGRLAAASQEDLQQFLRWAEDDAAVLPTPVKVLAFVVPAITWILLAVWFFDAVKRLPPLTGDTFGLWLSDGLINGWWLLPVLVSVTLSFAFAGRVRAQFDSATLGQRVLEGYASMLRLVCEEAWQAPQLVELQAALRSGGSAPAQVRALARLVGWSELRSGQPLLHFPIQALTLWDFHVLFAIERWRSRSGRAVRGWFDALGAIDALSVLSAVRADEPDWAIPSVDSAARELSASSLGHPLMPDDRVTNDVQVGPPGTVLFVTGSNMSGKSTLLRAIGLNTVLAQAGAPVCARALTMPPAALYTSIRVEDSLELGLSYFMAALARLKQIVDAAEHERGTGRTLLYLLDEILQGTNSVERAIAVRAVARHLLNAGAIGAMTSHDLTLAQEEPIKSAGRLVHFTEQVHPDGTMSFDYRLRPGLATSRNAIRLMQLIGITPE